mgnify:CR=1 FL=1
MKVSDYAKVKIKVLGWEDPEHNHWAEEKLLDKLAIIVKNDAAALLKIIKKDLEKEK